MFSDVALTVCCGMVSGLCIFFSLMWQVGTDIIDYRRECLDQDTTDPECEDELGWRLIHADVFRAPTYPRLYYYLSLFICLLIFYLF